MKTCVKLFSTPFSYYAYDMNLNDLIEISKGLYNELQNLNMNNDNYEVSDELKRLQQLGYFNDVVVKNVKNELDSFSKLKLEKGIKSLCLQLTQNCNLRCEYCVYSEKINTQQRKHSLNKMSFETAKKSIDFLLEHSIGTKSPNIAFYGGEPLLQFELMKDIIEYAEKVFEGKKINFNITTNGTLLTLDIAKYLFEHNVVTMISLDGPKSIHDKYRLISNKNIGSFEIIKKNIKLIKENLPDFYNKLSINSVVNPENDLEEISKITKDSVFGKLNKNYSIVDFTFDDQIHKEVNYKFISDSEYSLFLAELENLGFLGKEIEKNIYEYSYDILNSSVLNLNEFPTMQLTENSYPGGQCLPGEAKLFVDYEGNLYPCEKVCESNQMRIGTIYQGFDYEKIEKLIKFCETTENECKNCFAFQLCSTCIYKCTDNGSLSKKKRLAVCRTSRLGVEQFLRLKIQNYEGIKYMNRIIKGENKL